MEEIVLDTSQKRAIEMFCSNKIILLYGQAGSGKSAVVREARKDERVVVMAFTGVAARNVDGCTVHSFLHLGPSVDLRKVNANFHYENRLKSCKRFSKTGGIVIDEVSMLPVELFDLLEKSMRCREKKDAPFGGIRVLLTGDFRQLAPVGSKMILHHPTFENDVIKIKTMFNYRCTDPSYHNFLSSIRSGKDQGEINLLKKKCSILEDDPDPVEMSARGILMLSYTNSKVDDMNETCMKHLFTPQQIYRRLGDKRATNSDAPEKLTFKIGCKIMAIKNDIRGDYVNGSRGIVEALLPDGPMVLFDRGNRVKFKRISYTRKSCSDPNDVIECFQLPLRLGYAFTVHKVQGLTIDKVFVDLESFSIRNVHGLLYCALSRTKSYGDCFVTRKGLEYCRPSYNLGTQNYL